MKYVIINADDYGYRPSVSRGIIKAYQQGILTSTTVMVNLISDEEILLAKKNSGLSYGLHLNLTSGSPMTKNWREKYGDFSRPNRGQRDQFDRELLKKYFSKFTSEDIYLEYKSQLEKFVELFGNLPTHLDSHHYTSAFKNTFPPYIKLAKEFNLPVRRQVLFDFAANQHPQGNIDHIEEFNEELDNNRILSTNYFSLVYLWRYNNYLEILESELKKIDDAESIEISMHPGLEEDWRMKDLEILIDPKLREFFEKQECKLINFSSLKDINEN